MKYKSEFKHGFTNSEAVARRCSVKKMFVKISQNSQENTCTRAFFNKIEETLAQVFSYEFWEISKNTFFHRTPLVAAFPNHGYLHCAILKALHVMRFRKKETLIQGICNFFFKLSQMRFSRFSKCFKTTWNSPEQPAELIRSLKILVIIMVKSRNIKSP